MSSITTILPNDEHPIAPQGFVYSFSRFWETNRVHIVPGGELFQLILDDHGNEVNQGKGPLQVCCEKLPGRVHVYKHIIIRP